ncbi:unnamed protein product [Polarella glacialis]|nr:unnamed protein product [Polarella glacialis]
MLASDLGRALAALGLADKVDVETVSRYLRLNDRLQSSFKAPGGPSPKAPVEETLGFHGLLAVDSDAESEVPSSPQRGPPSPRSEREAAEATFSAPSCASGGPPQVVPPDSRGQLSPQSQSQGEEWPSSWAPGKESDPLLRSLYSQESLAQARSSASSGAAWGLGTSSITSLGSRVLRPPPPRPDKRDPARAQATMPAVYGPGASRAVRPGCFQECAARSRQFRQRQRPARGPSLAPAAASTEADPEPLPAGVPLIVSPHLEVLPPLGPLLRTPRQASNAACPFSKKLMDGSDVAVHLSCGHRFELSRLSAARRVAELVSGAGFAEKGALICPLCGEQRGVGNDGMLTTAYSTNADAYIGDLRKDWQVALRLPQDWPSLAPSSRAASGVSFPGTYSRGSLAPPTPPSEGQALAQRARSSGGASQGGLGADTHSKPGSAGLGAARTPPRTAPAGLSWAEF